MAGKHTTIVHLILLKLNQMSVFCDWHCYIKEQMCKHSSVLNATTSLEQNAWKHLENQMAESKTWSLHSRCHSVSQLNGRQHSLRSDTQNKGTCNVTTANPNWINTDVAGFKYVLNDKKIKVMHLRWYMGESNKHIFR